MLNCYLRLVSASALLQSRVKWGKKLIRKLNFVCFDILFRQRVLKGVKKLEKIARNRRGASFYFAGMREIGRESSPGEFSPALEIRKRTRH